MLVSLLSAFLGIFGAALPEVFKLYREKEDRKHELSMLEAQMKFQSMEHTAKLEEINAAADIAEMYSLSSRTAETKIEWVNALDRLVRPIMAYWFMGIYTAVKVAQYYAAIEVPTDMPWLNASTWYEAVLRIWGEEDMAVFVTIVTYYFGKRSFEKYRNH